MSSLILNKKKNWQKHMFNINIFLKKDFKYKSNNNNKTNNSLIANCKQAKQANCNKYNLSSSIEPPVLMNTTTILCPLCQKDCTDQVNYLPNQKFLN